MLARPPGRSLPHSFRPRRARPFFPMRPRPARGRAAHEPADLPAAHGLLPQALRAEAHNLQVGRQGLGECRGLCCTVPCERDAPQAARFLAEVRPGWAGWDAVATSPRLAAPPRTGLPWLGGLGRRSTLAAPHRRPGWARAASPRATSAGRAAQEYCDAAFARCGTVPWQRATRTPPTRIRPKSHRCARDTALAWEHRAQ